MKLSELSTIVDERIAKQNDIGAIIELQFKKGILLVQKANDKIIINTDKPALLNSSEVDELITALNKLK